MPRRETRANEAKRLRQDVEWALESAHDWGDLVPLLHRLVRTATEASEDAVFAHRQLAEVLVEREPWQSTLHARKVLAITADDERAWAALALSQTLLGNYRYAANAYTHALQAAPQNPWYAHNLGHLLDVALDKPHDAVPWLRRAFEGSKKRAAPNCEIAASFSHALARSGSVAEAKKVLAGAMKRGGSREHDALMKWFDAGAPPSKAPSHGGRHSPEIRAVASEPVRRVHEGRARGSHDAPEDTRRSRRAIPAELDAAFLRGVAHLPLTLRQRARARMLARERFVQTLASDLIAQEDVVAVHALAAALTYVIIYNDEVPLTQAEVAASFRVGSASMRTAFARLRSHLQLPRRVVRAPV